MSTLETRALDSRLSDGIGVRELVEPDPRDPRISRRIYGDPELFELESDRIFGAHGASSVTSRRSPSRATTSPASWAASR